MDTGIWDEIRCKLNFTHMGKPALIGMATILVLVAGIAVYVLTGTATASDFQLKTASNEQRPMDSEDSDSGQEYRTVFVHVSGAVASPGLYELEENARVADAVNAAGGFSDDAIADSVNLARVLADGEQVVVRAKQAEGEVSQSASGEVPQSASIGGKLNINIASAEELESLPGIGPSTARKIVDYRVANGSFKSVEDLTRVSGIGEKKLNAIIELICV